MPVIISMHRGLNVGGSHRIKMDALRTFYKSLKLREPETYIQSGSVVFEAHERDLTGLADRIEEAFEREFGFASAVSLRSGPELKDTVARNPFADRQDVIPGKLLVTFLASEPDVDGCAKVTGMKGIPEELHISGRELYIYYPLGAGQSKLRLASLEKTLKTFGTARNWNSVLALLVIAERREAAK